MKWNFTDIKVGMQINVQAYKHNGFLYRQWSQAKVIFHNKRHIVLSLKGTKVIEIQKILMDENTMMMHFDLYLNIQCITL